MSDIVCIKREIGDGDAAMWRALYQKRGEEILRLRAQLEENGTDPLISIAQSLATLASCVSDQDATYKYLRTQAGG